MAVKIKDAKLYGQYLTVKSEHSVEELKNRASFYCFRFFSVVNVDDNNPEIVKIANAIFSGEDIELEEQKYLLILGYDAYSDEDLCRYTAWCKGTINRNYFYITDRATREELLHSKDFKFTLSEIDELKERKEDIDKQIIELSKVPATEDALYERFHPLF